MMAPLPGRPANGTAAHATHLCLPPRPPVVPIGPILPIQPGGLDPAWTDRATFTRLDRDGDGVLSRNELIDSRFNPGRFDRFDADGDGNVDQKEYLIGRHWERLTQAVPTWLRDRGAQLFARNEG